VSAGPLVFLKLGGSLIGDKARPRSFRRAVVRRVGEEIRHARAELPGLRLLLAHGGGAAHFPARRYATRDGIAGGGGWRGFALTRRSVIDVNRRVLDALAEAGLDPILVQPSACLLARDGKIEKWDTSVVERLLAADQLPMIHGDAVLDLRRGFTIASTEEIFAFLAPRLRPSRVVLACDVEGVYLGADLRRRRGRGNRGGRVPAPLDRISRANFAAVRRDLRAARLPGGRPEPWDVTGGMSAKVELLFDIVRRDHRIEGRIVSGLKRGAVTAALLGRPAGTTVSWD